MSLAGLAPEQAAEALLPDLAAVASDPEVALRSGQRLTPTAQLLPATEMGQVVPPLRAGGVYLITGGLGKIGLAISEYLAGKYRAKLVLVGRSSLPGREIRDAWIGSDAAP